MAGLFLYYAHRLPSLARDLSIALKPRLSDPGSLFQPVDIVVPNLTMQSYLEQEIARQLGVTPNVRFHLLRSYLADTLSPPRDDETSPAPRILGAEVLQHILLDVLHGAHINPLPDCEALSAYLDVKDAQGHRNEAARELRLYQITEELARIFIEYSFSRSASILDATAELAPLLVKWSKDEAQDAENSIETWQKALWRRIFGHGGVLDALNARAKADGDAPYMTLAETFIAFKDAPAAQMPERVYMVGFPYIARIFVEGIQLLSGHSEVHVYALTPVQKWADSSSTHLTDTDHPLLHQWAKAGEIHAQMWAATGAKIRQIKEESAKPQNLLYALQNDIIASDSAELSTPNTQGIRFFECPSIAREVDAVTNEIWTLLKDAKEGDLRPDDIAVLIAGSDQESYQVQIGEAFRSFHRLPFKEVGLPATSGGRVLDAAKLLLGLPFSRFRRSELLKLLVHPNLRGRGEQIDADQWAQWCDKLGILYAASRAEQADSYLADESEYRWDLYNWDQGIRRVVLGNFLSGERSGVDALFEMGGSDYQPLEVGDSASATTSNFVALAGSLMADARWLCGPENTPTQRPAREWAGIVEDYFRTYLQVSTQAEERAGERREEDAYYLGSALRAIRQIGDNCPVQGAISYRIFNEFARSALDELGKSGGHHLSGGVVVSTVLETRALPFKHVFVLGLGEGQFPNPEIRNALDLRQGAPQLGDLKPADRDRYAFLETLLAARHSLTLSWVAREATTGDALNASSVVNELRWVLESRFAQSRDALTRVQPLRRYDAQLFGPDSNLTPNLHPRANEERRALALREYLLETDGASKPPVIPTLDALRRSGAQDILSKDLRKALKLSALPSETTANEPKPAEPQDAPQKRLRVHISLSNLRKFLESPLQAAATVRLGLREDEEDIFANEREPLEANHLYKAIVLKEVATRAFATQAGIEAMKAGDEAPIEIYNEVLSNNRNLQDHLPSGHFLASNRETHLKILKAWGNNFGILNIDGPLFPIGIGVEMDDPRNQFAPIQFELSPAEHGVSQPILVEISGRTELTIGVTGSYVVFDAGTGTFPRHKYISRAFISWAAATAAGQTLKEAPRLIVNNSHKLTTSTGSRFNIEPPDWSREDALKYLKSLVISLLNENHDYLLPIEYVAEKAQMKAENCTPDAVQKWLDKDLDSDRPTLSSKYGPIKDYQRFSAPRDRDIATLLDKRFPYLSWSEK